MKSYITERDAAAEKYSTYREGEELTDLAIKGLDQSVGFKSGADWAITQSTVVKGLYESADRVREVRLGFLNETMTSGDLDHAIMDMVTSIMAYESAVAFIGGGEKP